MFSSMHTHMCEYVAFDSPSYVVIQGVAQSKFTLTTGDTFGTETVFYHSEDNRRDFIHTRYVSRNLRVDLLRFLKDLYRDLPMFRQWALLLGYDGGRKRMYRRVNFPALIDKIDGMPLRQREKMLQEAKNIECVDSKL